MPWLLSSRRFALLVAGSVVVTIAQVTMGSWVPAFLMRVHGFGQQEVGLLAGPAIGLSGVVGTVIGGLLGTRIADCAGEERAPLKVMLYSAPLAVPALLLFLFAASLTLTLVGGALGAFFIAIHFRAAGRRHHRRRSGAEPRQRDVAADQFAIPDRPGPRAIDRRRAQRSAGAEHGHAVAALCDAAGPASVALGWVLVVLGYRALGRRDAAAGAPQ